MVAFHAELTSTISSPGSYHQLSFKTVHTNVGSSYNKYSGVVTCLVPGLYYFTWTVTASAGHRFDTELVKDGAAIDLSRVLD